MAQLALCWILMFPEVSTVIAGAKNPQQAQENAQAVNLPLLSDDTMQRVQEIYNRRIRPQVHQRW